VIYPGRAKIIRSGEDPDSRISVLYRKKTAMRKLILTYGTIAGTIVSGMFLVTAPLYKDRSLTPDTGMWVGYTTMVIALSLIFFAVKSYRDRHLGGSITFGRAFRMGLLITLVAALLYCLMWEICYNTIYSDFMEQMGQYEREKMVASGASQAAIRQAQAEYQRLVEWYKNPLVRFGFTLLEIVPVGLVISLLSAALLRRREFLPAA